MKFSFSLIALGEPVDKVLVEIYEAHFRDSQDSQIMNINL